MKMKMKKNIKFQKIMAIVPVDTHKKRENMTNQTTIKFILNLLFVGLISDVL